MGTGPTGRLGRLRRGGCLSLVAGSRRLVESGLVGCACCHRLLPDAVTRCNPNGPQPPEQNQCQAFMADIRAFLLSAGSEVPHLRATDD